MNKNIKIIVVVTLCIFWVTIAILGKNYYDSRYVGSYYYAMTPYNIDTTLETIYDNRGIAQTTGKNYTLIAYNEDKEKRELDFLVISNTEDNLLGPNIFLKISASEQIVLSWSIVDEKEVPQNVLEMILKNY